MTNTYTSNEVLGLQALRQKLVARRRSMVSKLADASGESISGESFAKLQGAIDAIDHAIADEHELAFQTEPQMKNGFESFRSHAGAAAA